MVFDKYGKLAGQQGFWEEDDWLLFLLAGRVFGSVDGITLCVFHFFRKPPNLLGQFFKTAYWNIQDFLPGTMEISRESDLNEINLWEVILARARGALLRRPRAKGNWVQAQTYVFDGWLGMISVFSGIEPKLVSALNFFFQWFFWPRLVAT